MSDKNIKKVILASAIGAGIGLLSTAIFIFMMAAVLAVGNIPAMLISPAVSVFLAFGSFCGGFAGARISGEKGILCGALAAVIYFLVIWVSGGIIGSGSFGTGMIIKIIMILVASSLGGIIGVNYIKRK